MVRLFRSIQLPRLLPALDLDLLSFIADLLAAHFALALDMRHVSCNRIRLSRLSGSNLAETTYHPPIYGSVVEKRDFAGNQHPETT